MDNQCTVELGLLVLSLLKNNIFSNFNFVSKLTHCVSQCIGSCANLTHDSITLYTSRCVEVETFRYFYIDQLSFKYLPMRQSSDIFFKFDYPGHEKHISLFIHILTKNVTKNLKNLIMLSQKKKSRLNPKIGKMLMRNFFFKRREKHC